MNRKIVVGLVVLLVLVLVIFTFWGLWLRGIIDVPPVVVYKVGQVTSAVKVRGTMTVQLPTKFHRQEHSLSCEVATLKMALATLGINVPESELISQLPFDKTPKGGGVWGNPNQGFVGNIDGKMLIDGYGVYWDPIARLGARYKRVEVIRNGSVADVASHIAAGRPVIVWGNYGRANAYRWLSSDGVKIPAVNGEHTRIVTGFSGTINEPISFSLIDPLYGPLVWPRSKFEANWSVLGNHAVVVYPHPRWIRQNNDARVWEVSKDGNSRHWVSSWSAFVKRGGAREYVVEVSASELAEYKRGADIN